MMSTLSQIWVTTPWTGLIAVVVVYFLDYYQTLRGNRLYLAGANQVIAIEGSYELNPLFTREIDSLRRVSPRFVLVLLAYSIFLWIVWYLCVTLLGIPMMYTFALGAVLLLQGPVQMRHVRNIQTFKQVLAGGGISGRIEYTRRFTYRASALEFVAFAGLYLVLALLAPSWLLVGGAFGCAVLALRQYRWQG